jgi:hypothetical protein
MNLKSAVQGLMYGMQVLPSTHLPTFTQVPVRKHTLKTPRGACPLHARRLRLYHLRVQKKWNKRWGTTTERVFYVSEGRILCSHANYKALMQCIERYSNEPKRYYP